MSIRISIIRDSQVTNQGTFPSMEEAQAWLDKHDAMGTFGQKAQVIEQQVEISPAVLAEDGSILQEAVTEMQEVHIPGSYEVEILDISAELAQQAINAQAKQFLNDTDKLVIRHRDQKELSIPTKLSEEEFQALLVERQAARDRVV